MPFLTTHPLWIAAVVLLVPTTLVAMAGPILLRRYVSLERLRTNNEVAGFKFATVGVLYAVMLAFAIVVVWEKFNQAESDVAREASAAPTVFRLSHGIDSQHGMTIRTATSAYLTLAIEKDWPAVERGHASPDVTAALNDVYTAVLRYHPFDANEGLVVAEILRQVDAISQVRRERLVMADGIVPGIIWLVLFTGAVLAMAFTFFFGTANLRAQTLLTAMLSLLIFGGLLTIVAIDHPFAGTERVGPEALAAVIDDFTAAPVQQ
jgi:hypothetical protein